MPCYAMLCHAMPCYDMLCHAMPCNAMLCHVMPCYAMSWLPLSSAHHNTYSLEALSFERYFSVLHARSSLLFNPWPCFIWVTLLLVCAIGSSSISLALLPAGLVVDACNSFKWPEDAECIVKLLSTILADTANVQIVVMLPGPCTMSRSQWIVDTPPHMSRYPTPDLYMLEDYNFW